MNKKLVILGIATLFSIGLTACGNSETTSSQGNVDSKESTAEESKKTTTEDSNSETQTITYLDKEYVLPSKVEKIATASLESMEDAAVLGVKPVGAITTGGKLPEYLAKDLEGAESIGEKQQPSFETLLTLKPDVILWTSKSKANVAEEMSKVAPTIPYSHISTNWEANLRLLAELTGKQEKAEEIIGQYKSDVAAAKQELGEKLKDKEIVVVRLRGGNINIYPQEVYFNPILYTDLELTVPEEVKAAKAQEIVSLEKFAEMNPDYIFVQFEESENAQTPKALEELQNNTIWKSMTAVKENHVFVNSVDPLAQGGTAWSKTTFLEAATENLAK